MVFSNLLGSALQPRRRSSAASAAGRPSSSSSSRSSRSNAKDRDGRERDNEQAVEDDAVGVGATRATPEMPVTPPLPPDYIAFASQLSAVAPEPPDLRALNHSLDALAVVFPDVQADVFREMLTSFDGESRLALVADALLKNRVSWVKGRWRVATTDKKDEKERTNRGVKNETASTEASTAGSTVNHDHFRTPTYIKAVTSLACREFAGLSRSTIRAVLAEHNYAYLDARRALVTMSAKSWRFALSSLFLRRKPATGSSTGLSAGTSSSGGGGSMTGDPGAESHPLVVWKSSGRGSILPTIKATGSAELDRELYEALVAPLLRQQRAMQETADRALAAALNTAEAEEAGATYECACCFTTAPFEEVTTCGVRDHQSDGNDKSDKDDDDSPHTICFRCVQLSVREAVFGQGWARTVDPDHGTLRCPAVCAGAHCCAGVVPVDQLHRALLAEPRIGGDLLHHLERRLAEHSLLSSGLPLVRCPFCAYAEVDDLYVASFHDAPLRLRLRADGVYSGLLLLLLLLGATPLFCAAVAAVTAAFVALLVVLLPTEAAMAAVSALLLPEPVPVVLAPVVQWAIACATRASRYRRPNKLFSDQVAAAVTRFRRRRRGNQFRCQNVAGRCGRVSCLRCGQAWTDIHVCHESALVRLRTQVEQAMSMAIKRVCPRCHTSFVKTAGCNKLTCPCGYKMCYVCRRDISARDGPDAGYAHFCDHFRPNADPARPCDQCRKCNLWAPEDTDAVLRAARAEAEQQWRAAEQRDLSAAERAFLETGVLATSRGPAPATTATTTTTTTPIATMVATTAAAAAEVVRGVLHGRRKIGTDGQDHVVPALWRLPTLAHTLDWLLETLFV